MDFHIFDDFIEGMQVINPEFRYHYVNRAVASQAKTTPDVLLGQLMIEKFPGIEKSRAFLEITMCMETGQSREIVNEFEHQDGGKGYFRLKMQRIPEGVLIISEDLTESKMREYDTLEITQRTQSKASDRN